MSFRIVSAPSFVGGDLNKAVVDEGREATLRFLSGNGISPGSTHVLIWQGRQIAMNVLRTYAESADGSSHYTTVFQTFGGSSTAEVYGIKAFPFADSEQKREAQLIAVEALLVYGDLYNGLDRPDGYNRVEFEGRQWVLSDFGYETSKGTRP